MNEAALGLASRVAQHVPCAESLKFVSDGAQATFFSLRFARAFTGRNKILKFAGAYHGHHDYAQHAQRDASGGAGIAERADTAGIPQQISSQVLVCPFNDLGSVEKLVAEFGSDLAAIIVEPIQRAILPAPGFLQGLRAICDRIGAMLVFDEIVTGFRVSLGGAQQLYGVTPDLCALGKIMGGGLPIAAVAGRRDILELSIPQRQADGRSIFLSGTLNGNPLCCAAGVATLDNLIACRGVEKIARAGRTLTARLRRERSQIVDPVPNDWPPGVRSTRIHGPPDPLLRRLRKRQQRYFATLRHRDDQARSKCSSRREVLYLHGAQ
jgi:glutamate-1-semialdehyde 2,1-aminomutase